MMTTHGQPEVRLLDLRPQNLALEAELQEAFARVLKSGTYIMGSEVEAFEKSVATYLGVPYALTVSSGTDALLLAMMALDLKPGDEVLCPSFTFFATAGSVARMGATPVFVDSCPDSFNVDPEDLRRKVTPRTKALIVVHLFGMAADLDAVQTVAREFDLAVIEDAAQAFGSRYREKMTGTIGDFGTYSFFPSKNFGGFGDSGLLVTSNPALAEKARILRVHGAEPKYYHKLIGGNFRMDPLQAALLAVKLPHQGSFSARRQANARRYQEGLIDLPGVRLAESGRDLPTPKTRMILPIALPDCEHIWNQYTVRVPGLRTRDRFRQWLTGQGIGSEIYYPVPLHEQECFAYLPPADCPQASQLAREVISLPIYPELPAAHQERIIEAIRAFLENDPAEKASAVLTTLA